MALAVFFLAQKINLLVSVALGVILYAFLVFIFKEVSVNDWKTIKSLLFVKKMDPIDTPMKTEI
jgi:hypothetical protein